MFEGLTNNLKGAFKLLSGQGKLTEANMREAMRQVRQALLAAAVNYDVAQEYVTRVTEQASGQ